MKEEAESGDGPNMLQVLEALDGCTIFIHTLLACHVNYTRGCKCTGLSLQTWFVKANIKSLSRKVVLLTKKGTWNLKFSFSKPDSDRVPRVTFSGGWKAFAMANNLMKDDNLLFRLSGKSQFHVHIFNSEGKVPMAVQLPRKEPSRDEVRRGLAANEETQQLPNEQANDADRDRSPSVDSHPRFCKQLSKTNFRTAALELPAGFAISHGGQLRTLVTLQGISQDSPTYCVSCSWTQDHRGTLRLFLRYGWAEFCNANDLAEGEELEFNLISDSSFVVRKVVGRY